MLSRFFVVRLIKLEFVVGMLFDDTGSWKENRLEDSRTHLQSSLASSLLTISLLQTSETLKYKALFELEAKNNYLLSYCLKRCPFFVFIAMSGLSERLSFVPPKGGYLAPNIGLTLNSNHERYEIENSPSRQRVFSCPVPLLRHSINCDANWVVG